MIRINYITRSNFISKGDKLRVIIQHFIPSEIIWGGVGGCLGLIQIIYYYLDFFIILFWMITEVTYIYLLFWHPSLYIIYNIFWKKKIFDLCECERQCILFAIQYTGKIIVIDKCCIRGVGGPIDQFFQLHNINVFLEKNMFTDTNTVNININIYIFFQVFLQ